MLGIIKWLIVLACVAALAYFAFFVPLGERTLYRHLVGIAKTDEAQELKDELSKKAQGVKEDVSAKLPALVAPRPAGDPAGGAAGVPLSEPSEKDRRALRELIERTEKAPEKK
jgi:hypothetical protein